MLPSWCGKDCTGYCPDCYEEKGEEMSEETLMRETISALHELVEVAFCKEDIEALLHIKKMISHRFMKEPMLFTATRDFCQEIYLRRLELNV